jgi:hypothetical protein
MKTIYKLSNVIMLLLICLMAKTQIPAELMKSFKSTDWKAVKEAKSSIENLQKTAISDLVKLLDNTDKAKLTNTGSLIYPGAEKFFGHGQILDYDIDYLAIRAGWLLEEISFNNFGFSGIHLPKGELITNIKMTFPDYYNNSMNRKKLESASNAEIRTIAQNLSIKAAKTWWESEGSNWTRLDALLDALKSFDEKRQVKALFYLRNGTTKCEGLTKEFYYEEVSKEIVRLSGSDVQRISEHAKLILLDSKLDWLKMKTE